jgi:hypothetical protein
MKELATDPDGTRYATALHRLFDLDPEAIEALTAAEEADARAGQTDVTDVSVEDVLGSSS